MCFFAFEIRERVGKAGHLDAEAGLAPVPALGVVAVLCGQHDAVILPTSAGFAACGRGVTGRGKERESLPPPTVGLCVNIPDRVSGSESNPLRHRAVLLLRLGKLLLGAERLVALSREENRQHLCSSTKGAMFGCVIGVWGGAESSSCTIDGRVKFDKCEIVDSVKGLFEYAIA